MLDQIITTNEAEGKRAVEMILRDLYQKMDAVELKWFVRVIMKKLPLGVGEERLFKSMHHDAKALYEVNANLEDVCEKLRDPEAVEEAAVAGDVVALHEDLDRVERDGEEEWPHGATPSCE